MFQNHILIRMVTVVSLLCACIFGAVGGAFAWEAPSIEKPQAHPTFPERPIDFICGWGVGGGADLLSRKVADLVRRYYGITLVVTNMPGAAGVKGIDYAMRQPHDGYTVFHAAWDGYMNYLLNKMTWTPEEIDVILCAQYLPGAYFVRKDSPFKTWGDVIEYSRAHPYKLKLADVGRGGLGDFTLIQWERLAGLKLTYVPYDNPSQRYAAFSGGHTDLLYEQPGDIPSLLEQGARALVFMAERRQPDFPDVPCSTELGYPVTLALWRGVGLAADTPPDIKAYLTKVLAAVCQSPEYQEFLKSVMAAPDSVLFGEASQKMFLEEYATVKSMMQPSQ